MVVSNAGPIIALSSLDKLDLLHSLFDQVLIPPGVGAEVQDEKSRRALESADWIKTLALKDSLAVQVLREQLDLGESKAIALAREVNADLVLLDDLAARRKAQSVGLNVVGTLGILLMGKYQGRLPSIKPFLDRLRDNNFRMSASLYAQVLDAAGESD